MSVGQKTASRPLLKNTQDFDPYYGQKNLAETCAACVSTLFSPAPLAAGSTVAAPGEKAAASPMQLSHFVAYILHRTRLPTSVPFTALYYLQQLKTLHPLATGSSCHRLFFAAYMIAAKFHCDDTYTLESWGIVSRAMFSHKEINQMERELCRYLNWGLNVEPDALAQFEAKVLKEHSPAKIVKKQSSLPLRTSRTSPTTDRFHLDRRRKTVSTTNCQNVTDTPDPICRSFVTF
ncbi:hypothetical protein BKA62DRAFT_773813 [Auriculariales sp. MPI-PUGE-AT-0066]|nr:hypothetical protein BKA62DRAFT_778885 [Auriculariales sp. MPI-PUGE-AT-0066]KAH7098001.1 hypothetical protein BKA62DRAFT_773813 [Auriculariales sp. MPI-PUGE-AT-0066]